jgi:hypothetical protein
MGCAVEMEGVATAVSGNVLQEWNKKYPKWPTSKEGPREGKYHTDLQRADPQVKATGMYQELMMVYHVWGHTSATESHTRRRGKSMFAVDVSSTHNYELLKIQKAKLQEVEDQVKSKPYETVLKLVQGHRQKFLKDIDPPKSIFDAK